MTRDWSSLPAHLLGLFFDRLYVLDFIRCRAVCTSWHLAASTENPHGPTGPQIPLLLLSGHGSQYGFRTLFSLAENRCYRLYVPEFSRFRCVGSIPESGFLITAGLTHKIFLSNPLTGAEFTLPAPVMYDILVRVLVSPQPQLISIIRNFCGELSFARVGEKRWTENIGQYCSDSSYAEFEDIVFHQNRLYGVCRGGKSVSFDVAASPPVAIPLPDCRGGDRDKVSNYYLAESTDGAQLLQIWRYTEYSDDIFDIGTVRTRQFKVFRLDPSRTEWVETKNIGRHSALFLGLGRSLLLSIRHLPELKGNCIYYTDARDKIGRLQPLAQHDTGIFNIEDGSCEPLFPFGSFLSRLTCPPPVWFTPHL